MLTCCPPRVHGRSVRPWTLSRVQCYRPGNPEHLCAPACAPDISWPGLISKASGLLGPCLLWAETPAGQVWTSQDCVTVAATSR